MFQSAWYNHYGERFWDASKAQARPAKAIPAKALAAAYGIPEVSVHRTDSYKRLLRDSKLRGEFKEIFLTQIFNVMNNNKLFGMVVKSALDPLHRGEDQLIYQGLYDLIKEHESSAGPMAAAGKMWASVKQLRNQRNELVREMKSILGHLGRAGSLVGYASIGDNGKTVLAYREHLGLKGRCWVVNDVDADKEGFAGMKEVLERSSAVPVGTYVHIDYTDVGVFRGVPDQSADLVTMNQGLHHLRPEQLMIFINEVYRVLRPSGIFIVREHNATPELIPMLDLAHSVYNAVLQVSPRDELTELRAFRPILEWRAILESAGFQDSMLYEMVRVCA
jgi:hypothetical protein